MQSEGIARLVGLPGSAPTEQFGSNLLGIRSLGRRSQGFADSLRLCLAAFLLQLGPSKHFECSGCFSAGPRATISVVIAHEEAFIHIHGQYSRGNGLLRCFAC